MNIRVDLNYTIKDGTEVAFRSPVDCSQVTGLKVYYIGDAGNTTSQEFVFADANGNNVGDIDHLFAENVVVKVILDVTTSMAFVQNADTNGYLEKRFDDIEENISPIVCEASGEVIALSDASNKKLRGLTVYGKTTQDGTPTPDAPVALVSAGDDGSIGVKVTGKNLLNLPPHTTRRTHEIYFSALDGGVRMVGTSTAGYAQNNRGDHYPINVPAGTYTLKMEVSGTTNGATFGVMLTKNNANATSAEGKTTGSKTITIEDGNSYGCFVYMVESGKTVDCVVKAILVPGNEAAEWEPYIEPQTTSVVTPNGLPGIPSSVSDEIDLARGACVHQAYMWTATNNTRVDALSVLGNCCRIGIPLDDKKGVRGGTSLCTHTTMRYDYSTDDPHFYVDIDYLWLFLPVSCGTTKAEVKAWLIENNLSVLYKLVTPYETPLSEEELAAYTAPHTNKLNTTIYNDAGTGMKVSYVADPKAYIDNKFNELAAAIVNNT